MESYTRYDMSSLMKQDFQGACLMKNKDRTPIRSQKVIQMCQKKVRMMKRLTSSKRYHSKVCRVKTFFDEQFNREEDTSTTKDMTNGEPMDQTDQTDPEERRYPQRMRKQTDFYATVSKTSANTDTQTLKMTLESENNDLWQAAIKELDALNKRKTWEMVDRPEGKPVLPSKVVLKIKGNADGSVDTY